MELIDKTIKINDTLFNVAEHYREEDEEVVILTRKIKPEAKYPSTLQDLGFEFVEEMDFADSEYQWAREYLESKYGQGPFNITIVRNIEGEDLLFTNEIAIKGPSLRDQDLMLISYPRGLSKISVDFLMDAVILQKRYDEALKNYNEHVKEIEEIKNIKDDKYQKILNNINDDKIDDMNQIFSLFDKFFMKEFNGK